MNLTGSVEVEIGVCKDVEIRCPAENRNSLVTLGSGL